MILREHHGALHFSGSGASVFVFLFKLSPVLIFFFLQNADAILMEAELWLMLTRSRVVKHRQQLKDFKDQK